MVTTSTQTVLPPLAMPQDGLDSWLRSFTSLHLDIGTGDGTFALRMAKQCPEMAVIGLDTNLDNLTKAGKRPQANLRFVREDAIVPPPWLHGRADTVSINFPYGALLQAIANEEDGLARILVVARPGAWIDIRVNASASADHQIPLDLVQWRLEHSLRGLAPRSATITVVPCEALRSFPSTWAKRLAYGRPSRVVVASAVLGE